MPRGVSKKKLQEIQANGGNIFSDIYDDVIKPIGSTALQIGTGALNSFASGAGQGLANGLIAGQLKLAAHLHQVEKHLNIPHKLHGVDIKGSGIVEEICHTHGIDPDKCDDFVKAGSVATGGSIDTGGSDMRGTIYGATNYNLGGISQGGSIPTAGSMATGGKCKGQKRIKRNDLIK